MGVQLLGRAQLVSNDAAIARVDGVPIAPDELSTGSRATDTSRKVTAPSARCRRVGLATQEW
jgi:hypothetical protein